MPRTITRDFHIADILSVTHGFLIASRRMEAIYDVLGFTTGCESLFTHQLPRACDAVRGGLTEQLPQSVKDSFPNESAMERCIADMRKAYGDEWHGELLRMLEDEHGMMIAIHPVDGYQADCPIEEAMDIVGPENVVTFNLEKKEGNPDA